LEREPPTRLAVWLVPAVALACLAGYIFVYATARAGPPIRSDGFSYYVYLPSWFIYGDTRLGSVANDCCGGEFPDFTVIVKWPRTRRWVNAHPIGVAVMQTPFFLVAHALTRWTNLSPDGFSLYYQHAAGLSGLAWTIVGLLVLQRVLRRHFSDRVTMATLVALLFGTNLYHYATYDSTYSHPYSFALFAALLELTERWHAAPARSSSLMLGLVSGLIVLTRHPNAILLTLVPLYGLTTRGLRPTMTFLRSQWRLLTLMVATALAVVAPQLAIYYQATGRPFVSSYGSLGFTFTSPHFYGVLFSVQKGLFFWSPLLLLAVAGLVMLRGAARAFLLPAVVVLAADTYVIASWWDWQFGDSYGHRGFIDVFPLLALGLAAFFEWSANRPLRLAIVATVTGLVVSLSVVQMLQYWNGVLPFSDTTWAQYRAIFLQLR
jgi:hypothetical protein